MHLTEAVLAPLRERYGEPRPLRWEGDVSAEEFMLGGTRRSGGTTSRSSSSTRTSGWH
jgi:hypothetical protein